MSRIPPCFIVAVCALALLALWSPSITASGVSVGECEVDGWVRTASPDFCCLPGFFFEQSPPNRTIAGPACTMCGPGTHACAEDGCCNSDQFCFRDSGNLPRCSSMQLRDGTASDLIPVGVVVTARLGTDPALDRSPTPVVHPPPSSSNSDSSSSGVDAGSIVSVILCIFLGFVCAAIFSAAIYVACLACEVYISFPRAQDSNKTAGRNAVAAKTTAATVDHPSFVASAESLPPSPSAPVIDLMLLQPAAKECVRVVIRDVVHETAASNDLREPLI